MITKDQIREFSRKPINLAIIGMVILSVFGIIYLLIPSGNKHNDSQEVKNQNQQQAIKVNNTTSETQTGEVIKEEKPLNFISEGKELTNDDKEYLNHILKQDLSEQYYLFTEQSFSGSDALKKQKEEYEDILRKDEKYQRYKSNTGALLPQMPDLHIQDKAAFVSSFSGAYLQALNREKYLVSLKSLKEGYISDLEKLNKSNTSKFNTGAFIDFTNKWSLLGVKVTQDQLVTIDSTIADYILKNFEEKNLIKITRNINGMTIQEAGTYLTVEFPVKGLNKEYKKFYVDSNSFMMLKRSVGLGYKNFFLHTRNGEIFDTPVLSFLGGYEPERDIISSITSRLVKKGNSTIYISLSESRAAPGSFTKDVVLKGMVNKLFNIANGKGVKNGSDSVTGMNYLDQSGAKELITNLY